jgi:RNA polymerase sigma-70 factor, ECF subfamily
MPDQSAAITSSPETIANLYEEYSAFVYRTALWILGQREEAEDALHDIFLGLYRTLATYDPEKARMSTWIYRVTVNHCLKRKTRVLWRFQPLDERFVDPGEPLLEKDHDLRQALSHLPTHLRALVVLRYGWEMTFLEISQILELPLGTVKSRHTQALTILRKFTQIERFSDGLPPNPK